MFRWFKMLGIVVISVATLAVSVAWASASTQTPAEFYKGKTIHITVPYGPGGGYDLYVRALVPYMEKLTGATVVVDNEPGAAGLLSLNNLYTTAPDGLTIGIGNLDSAITAELFNEPGCRYKLENLTWIARLTNEVYYLSLSAKSSYKTLADVLRSKVPIKIGAVSKNDVTGTESCVMSDLLGIKPKMVVGYGGSKALATACIQGEVDAMTISASSTERYAKQGMIVPILVETTERTKGLPHVHTVFEETKASKKTQTLLKKWTEMHVVTRSLLAPPKVPRDRARFLDGVVKKILADPAFIATAKKQELFLNYMPGPQAKKLADDVLGMSRAEKRQIKYIVMKKYY